ncbi:MAG: restriction endonuclease subunit S [candidate division SR1 bacterium]|nr:restriction endonuclease subunit S [candidate division SR1 bacterium]
MKVPKIRFKGFEGAWNIKNLGNNAKISTGTCVTDKETSDNYKYPVISGGKDIMGYYFEYNRKPNTITVARAGTAGFVQLIKTPFYLNDKCFSVISNSEIFNTNFLFFSLKNSEKNIMNLRSSTSVPTINTQHLNSLNISLPSLPEQEKIGSLFEQLDSQITKNQQKLEKLKNIKQSFLQKLFPKAGATVPELRFKGFEGAWEERKLGEIFEERHEVSTITEDYPQLSFSIAEGVIKPEDRKTNKRDFLIIDKANKKYLKTELDDIIYNPSNIVFGAIHRNGLCKGVVSPIYKIFSTQQDSIFMDSLVTRKIFINETKKFLEGTVTKLRSLKPEAFLNIKVLISSEIKEQRRIGQLFNVIDKQIKLYEPKIQKLQNIKQSLLEKMFI